MVKSLCSELLDAYAEWLNRRPWYIEEQEQKASEVAYAQFADETRNAAERLVALKQMTNVVIRTRHARELVAAFQSETNEELKAMILSRLDNESLSSLLSRLGRGRCVARGIFAVLPFRPRNWTNRDCHTQDALFLVYLRQSPCRGVSSGYGQKG